MGIGIRRLASAVARSALAGAGPRLKDARYWSTVGRKYRSVRVGESAGDFLACVRAGIGLRDDPCHRALVAREVAQNTWAERVERVIVSLGARRRGASASSSGAVPGVEGK